MLVKVATQGGGIEQLHNNCFVSVIGTGVVDTNNVWMAQTSSRNGLSPEPSDECFVPRKVRVQYFDGNFPAENQVSRIPDLSHATRSDETVQLVSSAQCESDKTLNRRGFYSRHISRVRPRSSISHHSLSYRANGRFLWKL